MARKLESAKNTVGNDRPETKDCKYCWWHMHRIRDILISKQEHNNLTSCSYYHRDNTGWPVNASNSMIMMYSVHIGYNVGEGPCCMMNMYAELLK